MTREYIREIFLWEKYMEKHYYRPDPTAKEAIVRVQSSTPKQEGKRRIRYSDLEQLPPDERLRAVSSLKRHDNKITGVMRTVLIYEARKEKKRLQRNRRR